MLSSFPASAATHLALPPGHNNRVIATRPQAPPINTAGSTQAPKTRSNADLKSKGRGGIFFVQIERKGFFFCFFGGEGEGDSLEKEALRGR